MTERCIILGGRTAPHLGLLGFIHVMDGKARRVDNPAATIDCADALATEVAAADPAIATAKGVVANIAQLRADFDLAVRLAREAVAPGSNSADMAYVLGIILNYAGDPGAAVEPLLKAMRLSPCWPMGYLYQWGISRFLLGELSAADTLFTDHRTRKSESAAGCIWLAMTRAEAGDLDGARKIVELARQRDPAVGIVRWIATESFRDPAVAERMRPALVQPGLQERETG